MTTPPSALSLIHIYQLCAVHGDLLDLLLRLVEHLLALGDGGGVIEVDDRTGCALDRLEGAADDVVAALGQHLHGEDVYKRQASWRRRGCRRWG